MNMVSGIDEMGEVMAGSIEEYTNEIRWLSDRELVVEIQSDIPSKQQHTIAVAEYNRRIVAK